MKNIKRVSALVMAVALAFSLVAVSPAAPVEAAKKASVTITAPTKKSTYTVTRAGKNKSFTIKYKVKNGKAKSVAFKSSDKTVASVSKKGKVTCKKAGTAKITVTVTLKTGKKVKDSVKVTVKQRATKLEGEFNNGKTFKVGKYYLIPLGGKSTLTPVFTPETTTNQKVSFKSSNKKIATVSSKGVVKGIKKGTATIKISAKDGSKKTVSVKVKVVAPVTSVKASVDTMELFVGDKSEAIKVTVKGKKGFVNKVAFSSSDKKVAKVNSKGVVTAVAAGTCKITVMAKDGTGKKDTIKVTVKPVLVEKIEAKEAKVELKVGDTKTVEYTVAPENATDKAVTFTSSDEKVATVDETGKITAVGRGVAQITVEAKDGSGVKTMVQVTVTDPVVTEVTVKSGVKSSFTIKSAKDGANMIKDVEEAVKTYKAELDALKSKTWSVVVGDVTYTVEYANGALTYKNATTGAVVTDLATKAEGKTVAFTIPATTEVADLFAVAEKIQNSAALITKTYTYTITIGKFSFADATMTKAYTTAKVDGKEYKMYIENGKLYVVGDVTEVAAFKQMKADGVVDYKVVK